MELSLGGSTCLFIHKSTDAVFYAHCCIYDLCHNPYNLTTHDLMPCCSHGICVFIQSNDTTSSSPFGN